MIRKQAHITPTLTQGNLPQQITIYVNQLVMRVTLKIGFNFSLTEFNRALTNPYITL